MTLSLCHPVYSNIAAVWVCRDRWVYKVFLWKFWVDQSLSAVVLPLDTVCMCVSCVNCWLLSSQQLCVCLVLSFVLGHIGIWMLGGGGGIHMCKWSFTSWSLTVRVYTHWHPPTYRSICAHPRDTLSSSPMRVDGADTQYPRSHIWRGGGIPCFCCSPWRPGTSFFISSKPAQNRLFARVVWGIWLSQNRCPVLQTSPL